MKCGECNLTYTIAQSLICKIDGKVKQLEKTCTHEREACEECKKQNNEICRLVLKRIPDITEVPDWCPKGGGE